MTYQTYLFSCLYKLYDQDFNEQTYDEQYYNIDYLYAQFLLSTFNVGTIGEYECMTMYLNDKFNKN